MTQDDKPQGLMSAEALASAQKDWDDYTWGGSPYTRGEGIALQARMLDRYPSLLAHIAAQDARIRNYDNMVEIYASHHSGCPRAEFLDRDCECGYRELIRLCRLAGGE